jgi:transcriptional regulator with XRE-family HTH domain
MRAATALIPVRAADAALKLKNVSRMSRNSNHGLGPLLRAHRERQGLTLEALAQSIKVNRSLLADLERNDVSRWPPGIYGRALAREYAKSIGLPADDVVRQFLDLLSAPAERCDAALIRRDVAIADTTAELRLTLADASVDTSRQIAQRLVGAAGQLAFVLATGCLLALATGTPMWTANAMVALLWLAATAVLCGHEGLYRILRLDRWSIFSTHSRATRISPATASLAIGKTVATGSSGAAADALFVEPDVQTEPSSPASIH